jgi:hypothetical protein
LLKRNPSSASGQFEHSKRAWAGALQRYPTDLCSHQAANALVAISIGRAARPYFMGARQQAIFSL